MMPRSIWGGAALALALCTSACSRSPRVSFYTMEPAARAEAPAQAAPGQQLPAVVVGPVTLPELVDRPQLVVRADANRVEVLEAQRWAEPLKSEIPRLIARNLGQQLGSNRVSSYYQQLAAVPAEYRVLLDLVRFESVPGDAVTVEARWSVKRGTEGVARTGRSLIRDKVAGPGYDAVVAAYGRALAALSGDLAAAIRSEELAKH
jgi:uncharacterized protein